jgi:hypothetical protein
MTGKAIYSLLSASQTLTAIVSTRIFPDMATQTAVYPFIVYSIDGTQPTDTKDGASILDVVDLVILVFANTYSQAQEVAGIVRTTLDRSRGDEEDEENTIDSIRFSTQQSAQMNIDKHVYIVEQHYDVREKRER